MLTTLTLIILAQGVPPSGGGGGGTPANMVTTDTAQTITGEKRFDADLIVNSGSCLGVGMSVPFTCGQTFHIADGNFLMDGVSQNGLIFKRTGTYGRTDPIFTFGSIQASGSESVYRILYTDTGFTEQNIVQLEGRTGRFMVFGASASGASKFEGYNQSTDTQAAIRLTTATSSALQMGPGGSTATDVAVTRSASNTLSFDTGGTSTATVTSTGVGVSRNVAGDITLGLTNTNNTTNTYDATISATVGGTSAGDPKLSLIVPGGSTWTVGVDNSDSDKLMIQPVADIAAGTGLQLATTGWLQLTGQPTSTGLLNMSGSGTFGNLSAVVYGSVTSQNVGTLYRVYVTGSNTGGAFADFLQNNANSAVDQHARQEIRVGGTAGGDPYTRYEVPGGTNWSAGTDNSDSDSYKVQAASTLDTSSAGLTLTTSGVLSVTGGFTPAAVALPTCAAGVEGRIVRDTLAGGTTGARTRVCLCTSDGAGSPAYAWQNIVSGTVGTTTTCSP